MTQPLDDDMASLEACLREAICALRAHEPKLTTIERAKLHSLQYNLRVVEGCLGVKRCNGIGNEAGADAQSVAI